MADGPRLGSTLCRVREFKRLGPEPGEVLAVNGGEALAMARRYGSQGSGLSAPGASRPVPGATPWAGEADSISASMSPSFEAGKALRDPVNAGHRS